MLTNRQLAENATFIAAVTWLQCAFCGYLSNEAGLTRVDAPCPHCGASGRPRRMFPGMSCDRLLEMIAHFYARAWERVDDTREALVKVLQKNLGREYSADEAVGAASRVHEVLRASDGNQAAFDRLLEGIRANLRLQSIEEALQVYVPLAQYSDTHEEHQVVVLLTAAMLEELFRELLLRMLLTGGAGWEEADEELKKLATHDRRERRLRALAGTGLRDAIGAVGIPEFYDNWQAIRELRNKFMHGKPFAIHVSDAEMAFELAKRAFHVFAHLHNRFCVATAAGGVGA